MANARYVGEVTRSPPILHQKKMIDSTIQYCYNNPIDNKEAIEGKDTMAKQQKKAAPVEKVKKVKGEKLTKEQRTSALSKLESKQKLQALRKAGVLNRRQQRLLAYVDGHGAVKGVPMVNSFEIEKKDGKKVLVQKFQQWHRI